MSITQWFKARRERRAAELVRAVMSGKFGYEARLAAIVAVDQSRGVETRWTLDLGNGWRQECVSRDGMTMSVYVRQGTEDDLADGLGVEAVALGLGVDFLDVQHHGLLVILETLLERRT